MSDAAARIKQQLREWIVQHASRPVDGGVQDDTLILEQRIITSLQVMELILFIERMSGKPLIVTQLQAGSFRNIERIYQVFFAAENTVGTNPGNNHAAT